MGTGKAWTGKVRQDRIGLVGNGEDWIGKARHGKVRQDWLGLDWQDRCGRTWTGRAGLGPVRIETEWQERPGRERTG